MNSTIENIITSDIVLQHFVTLQYKLRKEFAKNSKALPDEMIIALQESPRTTQWIKDIVLPGIYDGNEGINDILNNIETEKDVFLGNVKLEIVINILTSLEESLEDIKEANEEGDYSLEQNLINYEEQKRPFKTIH